MAAAAGPSRTRGSIGQTAGPAPADDPGGQPEHQCDRPEPGRPPEPDPPGQHQGRRGGRPRTPRPAASRRWGRRRSAAAHSPRAAPDAGVGHTEHGERPPPRRQHADDPRQADHEGHPRRRRAPAAAAAPVRAMSPKSSEDTHERPAPISTTTMAAAGHEGDQDGLEHARAPGRRRADRDGRPRPRPAPATALLAGETAGPPTRRTNGSSPVDRAERGQHPRAPGVDDEGAPAPEGQRVVGQGHGQVGEPGHQRRPL